MKLLKLVPDHTNIDFMRWRNLAVILSTLLTVASLVFTAYRGLNLGIDFVGGQVVRAEFAQPVHIEDLRARIGAMGVGEASIQALGNDRTYQIRLPRPPGPETAANQVVSKLRAAIPQQFPGARVDAGESVSGKVSEELASEGAKAIIFAMLGIAIYIWLRFEWQFGVGALLTLAHDVSMTLGFFAFTRLQVDLNVVAAILTIVGYSLNDTVVIYDRVRETMRKYKTMDFRQLINLSLNETLSRTILTVSTTALAVLSLLIFGGEVLRGFSIAMLWGIVIGTYSSLFIAAPLLFYIRPRRAGDTKGEGRKDEGKPNPPAVKTSAIAARESTT